MKKAAWIVLGGTGKRLPVARLKLAFLAEAAVHEEPRAVGFEQVPGTGDGPRRAEERQFNLHDPAFSRRSLAAKRRKRRKTDDGRGTMDERRWTRDDGR